jgi:ATP-dependent RNA helicase DDX27
MLFSATISSAVLSLAKLSLDAPLQLKVDPTFNVAETLQQEFVRLRPQKEHEREAVLLALASRTFTSHTIIFLPTKVIAHRLKVLFGLFGLRAAELHGNLTQTQRLQALDDFREAKADFLLATDLAGRGLDIRGVKTVINYTLPTELKSYVHRVGRTARAGTEGRAVSIVCERDRAFLKRVLKHAAEVVRTRTVPNESISHWVERIAGVEEEVTEVMQEEREEKALQAAERDAIKASNMIEHRDEIMSRPARSWFQTDKEKQAAKEASKAQQPTSAAAALASAGDDDPKGGGGKRSKSGRDGDGGDSKGGEARKKEVKRDKFAGMTRKKRRALQRAELFEGEEGGASLPNQKAIARGYKSAAKRAGGTHDGHRKRSAQELGMLQTGGTDRGGEGKAKKQRTTEASPRPHATAPAEGAGGGKDVKKVPKKLKSHSKAKFSKPRKRR